MSHIKNFTYFCIVFPAEAKYTLIYKSMPIPRFISYLKDERRYSPHTANAYERDLYHFKSFIDDTTDEGDVLKVDFHTIRSYVVHLMEEGFSPRSINRHISSLRAFYRYMLRHSYINKDPMTRQGNLKEASHVTVPYSEDELKELLSHKLYEKDENGVRNRMIIEMFYTLGIRRAELIGIKKDDIDLSSSTIKIYGKGAKERIIPLPPPLKKSLHDYLSSQYTGGVYLFEEKEKKLPETLVYRIINHYLGLVTNKTKKSPHVLRHSFATHMIENGADISSVKELLGHSSLVSTQVYTHTTIGKLKSVYNHSHPRSRDNRDKGETQKH